LQQQKGAPARRPSIASLCRARPDDASAFEHPAFRMRARIRQGSLGGVDESGRDADDMEAWTEVSDLFIRKGAIHGAIPIRYATAGPGTHGNTPPHTDTGSTHRRHSPCIGCFPSADANI